MHGLKKFHDFSVNSWAPLSICGSDSQSSHSSSIHESTVCRVYIMHGHTAYRDHHAVKFFAAGQAHDDATALAGHCPRHTWLQGFPGCL